MSRNSYIYGQPQWLGRSHHTLDDSRRRAAPKLGARGKRQNPALLQNRPPAEDALMECMARAARSPVCSRDAQRDWFGRVDRPHAAWDPPLAPQNPSAGLRADTSADLLGSWGVMPPRHQARRFRRTSCSRRAGRGRCQGSRGSSRPNPPRALHAQLLTTCSVRLHDARMRLQRGLLRARARGLRGSRGRSSLRSWRYRIATNTCLDVHRPSAKAWSLPVDYSRVGILPHGPGEPVGRIGNGSEP
jgi:hypothetical protein